MLAREYCEDIKRVDKPVIVSHHMMMGLKEGQAKMSKSDPDSAIFMEDTVEDVNRKIKKAFCPEKQIKDNPIIDYVRYIIFEKFSPVLIKTKDTGDLFYTNYEDLRVDYEEGKIHPVDLKQAVAGYINKLLQPVRDHFEKDPYAKKLLDTIKKWQEEMAKKGVPTK